MEEIFREMSKAYDRATEIDAEIKKLEEEKLRVLIEQGRIFRSANKIKNKQLTECLKEGKV